MCIKIDMFFVEVIWNNEKDKIVRKGQENIYICISI